MTVRQSTRDRIECLRIAAELVGRATQGQGIVHGDVAINMARNFEAFIGEIEAEDRWRTMISNALIKTDMNMPAGEIAWIEAEGCFKAGPKPADRPDFRRHITNSDYIADIRSKAAALKLAMLSEKPWLKKAGADAV
jgi:hypothetical protein